MNSSDPICRICHTEIKINDEIVHCPLCGIPVHYACAEYVDWKCPNGCQSKLVVRPGSIEIAVTGNDAKEVETVSNTLLKSTQNKHYRQTQTISPETKEKKSPIEILVAKYGLLGTIVVALIGLLGTCITAYFGYMGIRTQVEAPIIATQTAENKISTATSASVGNTTTAFSTPTASMMQIPATHQAILRYEVKNNTNIYELPDVNEEIMTCPQYMYHLQS